MRGIMLARVQESRPGMCEGIVLDFSDIKKSQLIIYALYLVYCLLSAGMYLRQCHLLQKHSYFSMWEWMLLTLKCGERPN